jgi:electron transfer flavoprotein alpha subunit
MAGCSGARTIVAVNTDPQAPIFAFAHYGVVGDYRRAVPALTEGLARLAASAT